MTLRAKLVALFAVFGVTPIVALGIFTYVQSTEAVEALIAERTGAIAQRAAAEIGDRYAQRQSDLLLLAENAETQRLCRARAAQDPEQFEAAFVAADRYLRRVWAVVGSSWDFSLSPDGQYVAYSSDKLQGSSAWQVDLGDVLTGGR